MNSMAFVLTLRWTVPLIGETRQGSVIIIIIYPLTARVVGAPQMILQPFFSIFPCSPLPKPVHSPDVVFPLLPVCLVFFHLSLCLARWVWTDLMNGRHDHTTAVCVSLQMVRMSSCGLITCWILARTSSLVTWSLYVMRSIFR